MRLMTLNKNIKLKICGMRDSENIMDVVKLSPDYMGFIFYPPSPRYVGTSFSIPADFPSEVKRTGVFVNEKPDLILAKIEQHQLDFVQLHGLESLKVCNWLKKHNVKIIKVFHVDDETDFEDTKPFREVADYFLFDTKGKLYGGNARSFEWTLLEKYDQQVPFFISGGLTTANVRAAQALAGMNIHALDLNSGVEIEPGLKEIQKIKQVQSLLNLNFEI